MHITLFQMVDLEVMKLIMIPTVTPYMNDTLNAWEAFPDGAVYDYAFISVDNSYGKRD